MSGHGTKTKSVLRDLASELIDISPFAIIVTDTTGRVVDCNEQACTLTRRSREQLIGTDGLNLISIKDRPRGKRFLETVVKERRRDKIVLETLNGRIVSDVCVHLSEEPLLLCNILEDITDERRIERQFQQTHKMEAIGRLAGGVAHDINNVLGAIMGSASMLRLETAPDDPRNDDIETILNACRKGRSLTRDLLGFARKGKYLKEKMSLNDVAREVQQHLDRSNVSRIDIALELEENLKYVEGDRSQIVHALMNVGLNAFDAIDEQGKLTITTTNVALDTSPAAALIQFEPGPYVRLQVVDNGAGMEKEILEHVFEPFFTTKEKGEGVGLGLSMAYGVVKNHGGVITIDSVPGEGTTVNFFLPAIDVEKEAATEKGKANKREVGTHIGILLVDDEEMIRNSARRLLERLGYAVFPARNGVDAVAIYSSNKDSIQLVILDLIMPEMDGPETFRELRKINPEIKVLFSSGYSKDEKVEALLAEGNCGFVPKPFDLAALSESVARVLD